MPKVYDKANARTKPDWLKIRLKGNEEYADVARIVREHHLHTICSSGMCPNKAECWSRRTATFMILGDVCTRACRFCATKSGRALPPDPEEPERVAQSVALMGLRYAVITSVTRDDLPDGGAEHWAETVRAIKRRNPQTAVELLIPDFDGRKELIDIVLAAGADVVGHNVETTRRLTPLVRARAKYDTSLSTLRHCRVGRQGQKWYYGWIGRDGRRDCADTCGFAPGRLSNCYVGTISSTHRATLSGC